MDWSSDVCSSDLAGQAVAGYWPMADELDPRPLLGMLRQRGALVLLPCVAAKTQPLAFRRWDEAAAPPPGRYGIPAPPDHLPALRPDILLVPLVGFDAEGHRLGMGGGFYDATLRAFRSDGLPLLAIGYEIGRASCRERVCKYVEMSVVDVSLKKKKKKT